MARRFRFSLPLDTCLFTPLQLHPEQILRIGMTSIATSINGQMMDWRMLKREMHTTVVVRGVRIEYLKPFNFFSAPAVEVETGLRVRKDGMLLELDCRLQSNRQDMVRLNTMLRPVRLSGTEALDAAPTRIEGALLKLFQPDEIDPSSPQRLLPDEATRLERGELLGERTMSFWVSRADCEIADQWRNERLPSFAGQNREFLALESKEERLKLGLKQPLREVLVEYQRAMFFGDEGHARTRAYWAPGSPAFLHEISSVTFGQRAVCGRVIEYFNVPSEA
jgi:hypothetical protein